MSGNPASEVVMENSHSASPPASALQPATVDDFLQAVCRNVAALRAGDPAVQRITVRAGDLTVELDWSAASHPGDAAAGIAAPATSAAAPSPAPPAPAVAPAGATAAQNGASPVSDAADQGSPADDGQASIRAAVVGTFYRSAEPGAPPFVTEGDIVQPGQQVAILEAMKMMLPVEATCSGRIVEFLVDNGDPVEFDTPLIALAPVSA
jgi:acetyl-CoA carboxylase biotin carboxyl carrier protein